MVGSWSIPRVWFSRQRNIITWEFFLWRGGLLIPGQICHCLINHSIFFLICCFRKYLNLYFLDNNLFNGRKISQLHMTDRVHVIKYPLYKFFLHFMYFNDVFVNFAIEEITCQHNNDSKHIIVKFELFKHEKNTVVFWCFIFFDLWNKW